MFENIKKRRQDKILRLLSGVARSKCIAHFDNLQHIGVIFNVGSEQEWNAIYAFVREMEQKKKQVWCIGFQRDKQEIDYVFTHPQTSICHEKKDFTFIGVPKEGVTDAFTSRHYDLLIDLTANHEFFSLFIAGKSLADLKCTYLNTNEPASPLLEKIYDLLIRGDEQLDITNFIGQIKHYLNMIQK